MHCADCTGKPEIMFIQAVIKFAHWTFITSLKTSKEKTSIINHAKPTLGLQFKSFNLNILRKEISHIRVYTLLS